MILGHWSRSGKVAVGTGARNASNVFKKSDVYQRLVNMLTLEGNWVLDLTCSEDGKNGFTNFSGSFLKKCLYLS